MLDWTRPISIKSLRYEPDVRDISPGRRSLVFRTWLPIHFVSNLSVKTHVELSYGTLVTRDSTPIHELKTSSENDASRCIDRAHTFICLERRHGNVSVARWTSGMRSSRSFVNRRREKTRVTKIGNCWNVSSHCMLNYQSCMRERNVIDNVGGHRTNRNGHRHGSRLNGSNALNSKRLPRSKRHGMRNSWSSNDDRKRSLPRRKNGSNATNVSDDEKVRSICVRWRSVKQRCSLDSKNAPIVFVGVQQLDRLEVSMLPNSRRIAMDRPHSTMRPATQSIPVIFIKKVRSETSIVTRLPVSLSLASINHVTNK